MTDYKMTDEWRKLLTETVKKRKRNRERENFLRRERYQMNKEKELAQQKEWVKNNREKSRIIKKKYEENHKEKIADKTKSYRRENPDKYHAHILLGSAVRYGKIRKPKKCSICGEGGIISGHHEDYSKPLDVIWVCPLCHKNLHTRKAA